MAKKPIDIDETEVVHYRLRSVNINFLRNLAERDGRKPPQQLDFILTIIRNQGLFSCPSPEGKTK